MKRREFIRNTAVGLAAAAESPSIFMNCRRVSSSTFFSFYVWVCSVLKYTVTKLGPADDDRISLSFLKTRFFSSCVVCQFTRSGSLMAFIPHSNSPNMQLMISSGTQSIKDYSLWGRACVPAQGNRTGLPVHFLLAYRSLLQSIGNGFQWIFLNIYFMV